MKDVYILTSVISLFAGVSSISISCFTYNNNKKTALKLFILFMLSLFSIQSSVALGFYLKYTEQSSLFVSIIYRLLDILGTPFSSFLGVYFLHYLLGLKITTIKNKIFLIISLFQLLGTSTYYLFYNSASLKLILHTSIIVVILYEIYLCIKNYKQIANNTLKHIIKIIILITLIFVSLTAIEYYQSYISFLRNAEIFKILALPVYFLVINIINIIFTLKYFSIPSYAQDNKLTDYFKNKYGITEKQSEIITLILEGNTYKEIAAILYISPKTVDNHIQNIYKKLNVKNKIQLANFIHSTDSI